METKKMPELAAAVSLLPGPAASANKESGAAGYYALADVPEDQRRCGERGARSDSSKNLRVMRLKEVERDAANRQDAAIISQVPENIDGLLELANGFPAWVEGSGDRAWSRDAQYKVANEELPEMARRRGNISAVVGILAASSAVTGIAAGVTSPAVAFGFFVALVGGLSLAMASVRGA